MKKSIFLTGIALLNISLLTISNSVESRKNVVKEGAEQLAEGAKCALRVMRAQPHKLKEKWNDKKASDQKAFYEIEKILKVTQELKMYMQNLQGRPEPEESKLQVLSTVIKEGLEKNLPISTYLMTNNIKDNIAQIFTLLPVTDPGITDTRKRLLGDAEILFRTPHAEKNSFQKDLLKNTLAKMAKESEKPFSQERMFWFLQRVSPENQFVIQSKFLQNLSTKSRVSFLGFMHQTAFLLGVESVKQKMI